MKLFILFLLFIPLTIKAQTASYGKIQNGKKQYKTYITKEGKTITIGDTLKINTPSSDNGFNHITQLGRKAAVFLEGREIVVHKIRTFKDKRFTNRAYISFKGYGALVDIDYELALKKGEIEN